MRFSEILKENKLLKHNLSGKTYEIAVISNIIVHQLKEILEFTLRSEKINANCRIGNYDNILQDAASFKKSDLLIIFWEAANIISGLQYKADLLKNDDFEQLIVKTKNEIDFLFNEIKDTSHVIINKFSSIIFNHVLLEENKFDLLVNELNTYIVSNKPSNVSVIDTDKIISSLSVPTAVDFRYFYTSKALYTIEFFRNYSLFINPIILNLNGKTKKALIFDCDNTLWKGILGEDGLDGIAFTEIHKMGVYFEEIQSIAKSLTDKGIILGLCSKNNSGDVNEVFETRADHILKPEDMTIKKVNWNDKASNLVDIKNELNIGLDSLVFVDDSDFEINLVKSSLPVVTLIKVPEDLSEYPQLIRAAKNLFYNLSSTKEDKKRLQMYNDQIAREANKMNFSNLDDYIKSLGIELSIFKNSTELVPRMAQLTQKTNQFNFTTKRYSENDIKYFVESPKFIVYAIGVKDKFGDSGITALMIIDLKDRQATIDTFLMSCRIIGRNIESVFLNYVIEDIKKRNTEEIRAKFSKTIKNIQVENFYENFGFELLKKYENEKTYKLDINSYTFKDKELMKIKNGK